MVDLLGVWGDDERARAAEWAVERQDELRRLEWQRPRHDTDFTDSRAEAGLNAVGSQLEDSGDLARRLLPLSRAREEGLPQAGGPDKGEK